MRWSPASYRATTRHWNVAAEPVITGTPPRPRSTSTPLNFSVEPDTDICRETGNWAAVSTLMQKWSDSSNAGSDVEVSCGHHSTSGGSMDTDVKEFAVTPMSTPSALRVVTIVTPVA